MEALTPLGEIGEALGRRALTFIRHIVGKPREGINRGDMRAHVARQQAGSDRKILVVLAGEALAVRVRVSHHSISAMPER
jgi:hypothetical protein